MKVILSFLILFLFLSCNIDKDKKNELDKQIDKFHTHFDRYDVEIGDLNYTALRYDTLILRELRKEDFSLDVENIYENKEENQDIVSFFCYKTSSKDNKVRVLKHILHKNNNYLYLDNDYVLFIEFFDNVYNYKIISYNKNKCVYLKWKTRVNNFKYNQYVDLFIGPTTDTLFTNMSVYRVKKILPYFEGVYKPLQSKKLIIDYNYSIETKEFYDNMVID